MNSNNDIGNTVKTVRKAWVVSDCEDNDNQLDHILTIY